MLLTNYRTIVAGDTATADVIPMAVALDEFIVLSARFDDLRR